MDTSVELTSVVKKEDEWLDYENEDKSVEWNGDPEFITVKVELADAEFRENNQSSQRENLENTLVYQNSLQENRNPVHFDIAKLSEKLNSKLNNVLCPQNDNCLTTAVGSSYYNVSEANCIGGLGRALQCTWCQTNVTNMEELRAHKRVCSLSPKNLSSAWPDQLDKNGAEKNFVCDICGRRFTRFGYLKRHYFTHNQAHPFSCIVCKAGFSSAQCLKDHQISHLKDMPYICPKCNRGFPNRDALKEHARVHIKDMPFSCRFCGKRFMQAKNLNFHMKVHSGLTIYPCDECEKAFDTEEEKAAHKKQHNVVMPYKCGFCNQAFPTQRQRQIHSALHDQKNTRKCVLCNEAFANEEGYRTHVKEKHNHLSPVCSECECLANSVTCDDSEEFMCEDCDLPFLHMECLVNHTLDHQDEKILCEQCGRGFPLVSAFHRHMFIHTGERPFTCTECEVRFSARRNLKEHMRKHWRDRPYACKLCGDEYSFNNMMAHLLTHAGVKTASSRTGITQKGRQWKEGVLEASGMQEEYRRSLRTKSSFSYLEKSSDELEDSGAEEDNGISSK